MIKKIYILIIINLIFSSDSPSDKYLNSIDVENKIGNKIDTSISLVNENGDPFKLSEFLNYSPTVLVMAYYECPMLCSMVMNGLSDAINGSNLNPGLDFNVLTVSIDPSENSDLAKQKKKSYIDQYFSEIKEDFWTFSIVSNSSDINKLSDQLGFNYSYDSYTDQYAHPAVIYILNQEGEISHHLFGVSPSTNDFTLAINEASNGKFASIFDKILLYCYQYNPDAGSYSIVATNVMKLSGVATMFAMASFLSFYWYKEGIV